MLKYNIFDNSFLLPEAADYRQNLVKIQEKENKALYVGVIPRKKENHRKHRQNRRLWNGRVAISIFKKYKGQIGSADYYQTISKYKSFLMELNDPTPHLNAKILILWRALYHTYYEPFDKTYELPSGSYYRYNNPAEVGALIDTINDLSEEE